MSLNMNQQTFHRKTVWLLMQMIDQLQHDIKVSNEDEELAIANADRLDNENVALRKRLENPPKVTLPAEVAKEIRDLQAAGLDVPGILGSAFWYVGRTIPTSDLQHFASLYPFDLTRALEFGYEIEPSPEEKLFQQYLELRNGGKHDKADLLEGATELLGHKELAERMYQIPRDLPF